MNATEVEEFKPFKACRESQRRNSYKSPWATKVKSVKIGYKNRKITFSDEVEKTESAKEQY